VDDEPEAERWLSYAELADLRGISKTSATRMAFCYKWRRQERNDGAARVFVLRSALHGKGGSAIQRTAANDPATRLFRQRVEAAETRADQVEARAQRAQITAEVKRSRAAQKDLDRERSRADELRSRADVATPAGDSRRGLGLPWQLTAAWRGE
jgi:hypothetical protein